MFRTYQTKLKNEMFVLQDNSQQSIYDYFHNFAQRFGSLERKLFVDMYVRNQPSNELKTHYCAKYYLTARQYNSIKNQLDGRVSSKIELNKLYIEETKEKMKHLETLILKKSEQKRKTHAFLLNMTGDEPSFLKKVKSYRSLRHCIHQKKRKLRRLQLKWAQLKKEQKDKIIRLCFGSKELFHKQFHLDENNLTFERWKRLWQESRASQFTFIGSKDETCGNQSCTYDLYNNLRIRVNTDDENIYGKYIVLPNVTFTYGQKHINQAKIPTIGYTKGKGNKTKYYRALTCKFIRKENQWYLNMSVDVDMPKLKTLSNNGCFGIDFNANFLAVAELDRFGNFLHSFHVPFKAYHASSEQAKQSLSHSLKKLCDYALEQQKPIAHEALDFKKKKQQIKQLSKKQAKMLSGFAYSSYQSLLKSKCEKSGIERIAINPAYTSQIGHHTFMKKYGLSSHESAAMVIARRAMGFEQIEKMPNQHLLKGNKEKIVGKKRIDQWKELIKQWKHYSFKQKNLLLYKMF